MSGKGFLSLRRAARVLGVSKERVRAMVAAGLVPAYRPPGARKFYIPWPALEALLRGELEVKKPPAGEGGE
jgi:excisionase family DNA binding protein